VAETRFPLVSLELLLRLPCAVVMILFRDRCKRGSGWKAGAAICPTGSVRAAANGSCLTS